MDESIHQVTSHEESVKLLVGYSRPALPLNVFNRSISCLPTPKPEEPANDAASMRWLDPTPSRPNGVTTTGGRPPRPHLTHLTSNPFPHLISPFHFSFIAFSHSLLDWNRFNRHLITFWMFIVPLLQHLLHLLIPVRLLRISLQSNVWRCPSRIEESVSGALISSSSHQWKGGHLLLINNNTRRVFMPLTDEKFSWSDLKAI